jgi:hypothetical protein
VHITYSGIPGQGTAGPFTTTAAADGAFSFSDPSQESQQIACTTEDLAAMVTISATDGEWGVAGTGYAVSTTVPATDWCNNAAFASSGSCTQ